MFPIEPNYEKPEIFERCPCCKKKAPIMKFYNIDGEDTGVCLSCRIGDYETQDEPDDENAQRYIEMLERKISEL